MDGTKTPELDPVAVSDEVIVNAAGSTARQAVRDLGTQLLGTEPLGTVIEELESSVAEQAGRIENLELRQVVNQIVSPAWLDGLKLVTPTTIGQGAEVLGSDTGTHVDPKTAATVANAGLYQAYALTVGAWTRIGESGLAAEIAARQASDKVNGMVMTCTSQDGGATYDVVTVPALTATEIADGKLRRFRATFDTPNTPVNGQIKVRFAGSSTARIVHTFGQKNPPVGALRPGVYYDVLVGNLPGVSDTGAPVSQFRAWVNIGGESVPAGTVLSEVANSAALAREFKRRLAPSLKRQVPDEFDTLSIDNGTTPVHVGLQASDRIVAVKSSGQQIDLRWMRPGTRTQILVANAAGTASARLQIAAGATVMGPASSEYYDVPHGSLVSVSRMTAGTLDVWHVAADHGSVSVASQQTDVARSRCLILAGQSLALRWCQGYGPMALEQAFADRGASVSTRILNVAAGSSSLFYANDTLAGKPNHWWDERYDTPGPLALAAVSTILTHLAAKPAAEPVPALMIFSIGQNDADNIGSAGTTTMASVRAHYRKVAAYIRAETGLSSMVTAIDMLGADDGGAYSDGQCSMFRRAQLAACKTDAGADDPLIRPGAELYDLPRAWDDVHITLGGQVLQAERYADLWLDLIDQVEARSQGVEVVSTAFTAPSTHHVTLRSDFFGGTRYGFARPTTNIPGGVAILPNAVPSPVDTPMAIASWSLTSGAAANELTFNFSTLLPSAGHVPVMNWGRGGDEAELGRLIRSILTDRGLRTYDPRPIS